MLEPKALRFLYLNNRLIVTDTLFNIFFYQTSTRLHRLIMLDPFLIEEIRDVTTLLRLDVLRTFCRTRSFVNLQLFEINAVQRLIPNAHSYPLAISDTCRNKALFVQNAEDCIVNCVLSVEVVNVHTVLLTDSMRTVFRLTHYGRSPRQLSKNNA